MDSLCSHELFMQGMKVDCVWSVYLLNSKLWIMLE